MSIDDILWKIWDENTLRAFEVFLLNAFSLSDLVVRLERCHLPYETKCNEAIIWTCQLIQEDDIISREHEVELVELSP